MTAVAAGALVSALRDAIVARVDSSGADTVVAVENRSSLLLVWIGHLLHSETTGTADGLLEAARSAIVEVAGSLSIGFVRPALMSLRTQTDSILSWLYFRNHPVEWSHLEEFGDGFVLKREALEYLDKFVIDFKRRRTLLSAVKRREVLDPYKILSAHIHVQNPAALPSLARLDDLVADPQTVFDCLRLQGETSEFLSDVLLSVFAPKWASLPDSIMSDAKARLGKGTGNFFK